MDFKQKYDFIIDKLRSVRAKESLLMLMSAGLLVISITLITILVASLVETVFFGDKNFRFLLAMVILTVILASVFIFIYPAFMRRFGAKNRQDETLIARRVGEHYGDIKDKLSNSIELIRNIDTTNTSKELSKASFSDIADTAANRDFEVIIDKKRPRKFLYAFLITLFIAGLSFTVFSGSLGAAFLRIVNFDKSYTPPAPFYLTIEPVNKSVLKGEKVKITVRAPGTAPIEVKLNIREINQGNFDTYNLNLDSGNIYTYEIPAAKNSIYFYASSDWMNSAVESKLCTLYVVDKPIIKQFSGTLIYPAYTRLGSRSFDEQGADVSAIRGSSLNLNIVSNKELASAKIIFIRNAGISDSLNTNTKADSTEYNMKISGKTATGGFSLNANGQYYIRLKSTDGNYNENPIKHNVYVTNDEYPSITLIQPYGDAQVGEDAILPMQAAVSDDYGFSGLKLYYRLVESKYTAPDEKFKSLNVPISSAELTAQVPYVWDMNKTGISPEDKFEYYFEVYDNDRISGPKSARTNVATVRLPSLNEILKQADEAHNQIEKELEKVLKQTEDLKKESEQLNRDLLKDKNQKQELNWEQKKKADELAKRQQEIQNKVEEMQKTLQNVTEKLKENNLISRETLEKYMELQKLLKEIKSPELQKLQDRMKAAMDKLTPEQLQEAMKNFKFDEEKLKQNIERTMKMLKRIQNEQKIDALNRKAEDMINKLDEMNKQMNNTNPSDQNKKNELANKQEQLKDDLNTLNKDLNELEKSLKETGKDNPEQQMKDAKEQLNAQQTEQEMNSSKENMQKGNFSQANKNQQQARQNLKNFKQSMQNMKNSMQSQLTKEAIRKMQKATKDMAQLSKNQENIKNRTQNVDPGSTQFKDIATQQSENMAAMNNVLSSMFELAQKTFAVTPDMAKNLGNAMQNMQKSIQELSDRSPQSAGKSQQQAMSDMNKAISQMNQMVSQMQKTGSCSNPGGNGEPQEGSGGQSGQSMMQKLQQLAAQQQAINQAMQQMGMGQGSGGMSPEQQAKAEKLSNQQGNARKSLEELNKEQKQFSGGQKKPLGDLERIAQEMQEVMNEMKNGNYTPETQKKQERILSRLLDATRSMTERDFDKKRESNSGQDIFRKSPNQFDMSTQQGKADMMKEFLRSVQNGYNKDYEILIKQYFEQIQK